MQTRNIIIVGIIVLILLVAGLWWWMPLSSQNTTNLSNEQEKNMPENNTFSDISDVLPNDSHRITIETNKGRIVFQTYDADAPNTVSNFIKLANKKFYDGVIFHRVISGFMIQGGDPSGTGRGGPGYEFDDELNAETESYKNGYKRGVVAMANAGPNTNGSQFFIMHQDYPLPNNYTIFGHVVEGIEIVDAIAVTETDSRDKPHTDVVMESVTVEKL
jgi:cyclophilin family peptidyl-prolyl cis-trans isomerase